MPYSDNLYSTLGDSDDEDYAGQLSPSDGYFASSSTSNIVPTVPNVMVNDPTLQESESSAESKAREASEERRSYNTERYQPRRHVASTHSRQPDQSERGSAASFPSSGPYYPTQPHTSSHSSALRTTLRTDSSRGRTPSLYSDAPPAYSPSPTTPLSATGNSSSSSNSNQPEQPRNYNTFSAIMGAPGIENERLLGRDPESMGDLPIDQEGVTPVWSRRIRRRLPGWLNWKIILLALIVLIVSAVFLFSSSHTVEDDHKSTIGPVPVEGETPDEETPDEPVHQTPEGAPFEPTFCKNAKYRYQDQVMALTFDEDHNVTFLEDQHTHSGKRPVRVGGQVNIRKITDGGDPRIVVEIATNDEGLKLDVFPNEEAQVMKVSVPKEIPQGGSEGETPCVELKATIWVPEGGAAGVLTVGVIQLDILLLDDLDIHVADYSRLSSVTGDIVGASSRPATYELPGIKSSNPDFTFVAAPESYQFDSRVIEVSTTSGRIDGNWPLYDLLGLHTTSGDLKVSVAPKPELESDPKSAVLSLSSISGAVHAFEPVHTDEIPARNYLVDVKSTSGEIHGALAFGAAVDLKSTASDIAVDLLPIVNRNSISPIAPAQLETVTTSGTTAIRILEPIWFGGEGATAGNPESVPFVPIGSDDPYASLPRASTEETGDEDAGVFAGARALDCLQSIHKSTSGNIGLSYPQAWEGFLDAEALSGKLKVTGKDVKIIKSSGGWGSSKLQARKGADKTGSTVQVSVLSGSLNAVIGDE